MALSIVPAGDSRCEVCPGRTDRPPRAKPGEGWPETKKISTICETCYEDFQRAKRLEDAVDEAMPPDEPAFDSVSLLDHLSLASPAGTTLVGVADDPRFLVRDKGMDIHRHLGRDRARDRARREARVAGLSGRAGRLSTNQLG